MQRFELISFIWQYLRLDYSKPIYRFSGISLRQSKLSSKPDRRQPSCPSLYMAFNFWRCVSEMFFRTLNPFVGFDKTHAASSEASK